MPGATPIPHQLGGWSLLCIPHCCDVLPKHPACAGHVTLVLPWASPNEKMGLGTDKEWMMVTGQDKFPIPASPCKAQGSIHVAGVRKESHPVRQEVENETFQFISSYFCWCFLFPFLFRSTSCCLSAAGVGNGSGEKACGPCTQLPELQESHCHTSTAFQTPKCPLLNLGPSVQLSKQPSAPRQGPVKF